MLTPYRQLVAKVDGFFVRVRDRHGEQMRCGEGCSACCRTRLTITGIEAEAIGDWARDRSEAERRTLAAAGRAAIGGGADRCVALDQDDRCRIYPARPLVCRSHGVPVRLRGERSLPVITSCELNFTDGGPGRADPDCVLDQELVSTTLGLLERTRAEAAGTAMVRRDLAEVLAELDPGDDREPDRPSTPGDASPTRAPR